MRSLRKSAMFSEGQRTEGHFRYPGASNAITIIVDLRSEHDLKVLLKVGHADSATNMQVIGLTHRPTGFNGRRWLSLSQIKSAHIGGAARRELGDKECFRPVRWCARPARPSPRIDACVPHYDISGKTAVRDGGAALRTQQRGQGIPVSDRTDQTGKNLKLIRQVLTEGIWSEVVSLPTS